MKQFYFVKNDVVTDFLIEKESFEGVKRIGQVVAKDMEMVCDKHPVQRTNLRSCESKRVILFATLYHSPLLELLETKQLLSLEQLKGKNESYSIQLLGKDALKELSSEGLIANDFAIEELLIVAGSDKRGTIYGMFRLSEFLGVSPLVYWGDVIPKKIKEPYLELNGVLQSKEPSVKYRGFFINDEWPAFGNWCMEKFGGVNAKVYEKIFELLLRLKGNYMWPAMWNSSFSEDGPGILTAQLADMYGIVMGLSHHEPMCRSGVEWQNQYRTYGTDSTWSFVTNAKAISEFWKDGIIRNKDFENVITIGMRGENDSKLMPETATLKDNIEVIKHAIRTQQALIKEHIPLDNKKVPQMLAIYKEVEDYYFGDDSCEGLKDWEDLADVIFLLSDDNYGNLRALPTPEDNKHKGGYGMYYHFDYHGAPISYEWTNCNRLTKIWEQMTVAYEAGVKEMWIVNVGDLKGVEYPLCYFLELAYDFDTWGSKALNQTKTFVNKWVNQQFYNRLTEAQKEKMLEVIEGYTKWNGLRSPESMQKNIFHSTHFREGERVFNQVQKVIETANELKDELTGEALLAYESMIYYTAVASLNLILMYLEAGENEKLAKRGCIYANEYAKRMKKRMEDDVRLVFEFHNVNQGKWNHFMSSAHTGFRTWDDNDWTYPSIEEVTPISKAKAVISFRGSENYHLGAHWQDQSPLTNDDFTRLDTTEVLLDLDSRGCVSYTYDLQYESEWLLCTEKKGRVEIEKGGRKTVCFGIDRDAFYGDNEVEVIVDIVFDNGQKTKSTLRFLAIEKEEIVASDNQYVFLEKQGYCSIYAKHFNEKKDVNGNGFQVIDFLGREGEAIKAYPALNLYKDIKNAPYVRYNFAAKETGIYHLKLYILARNPSQKGNRMRFGVSVNDSVPMEASGVSNQYYTEWFCYEWADGVLSHARTVTLKISVIKGLNDIYLYAKEPGIIFEKLVLYKADYELPESYLGPPESDYIK